MLLRKVHLVFLTDPVLFYLLAKLHVALKAAHIILRMDSVPNSWPIIIYPFSFTTLLYDIEGLIRGRDMLELKTRAVQLAAREDIFQAIAQGALKARAGRLAPESSMEVGGFRMMVVEDENGEGCAVQLIESRKSLEDMAMEKARSLDQRAEEWSEHDRRVWLEAFWRELGQYLQKWNHIRMRRGPGENITFEMQVSK